MKFPVPGHPAISSIIQPARQEKGRNLTTAKLPNELISYGHQLTGTEICLIFGKDVRWILEVNFCPGLRSRIQHVHVILAKGAWPKQYFFKATALPLNRKCPPGNFVYYTVQLNRLHPLSQNRLQLILQRFRVARFRSLESISSQPQNMARPPGGVLAILTAGPTRTGKSGWVVIPHYHAEPQENYNVSLKVAAVVLDSDSSTFKFLQDGQESGLDMVLSRRLIGPPWGVIMIKRLYDSLTLPLFDHRVG